MELEWRLYKKKKGEKTENLGGSFGYFVYVLANHCMGLWRDSILYLD